MKKQQVVHQVVVTYNKNKEIFGSPFFFEILLANRYQICYNISILRRYTVKPQLTKEFLEKYLELREDILYWKPRETNKGGFNTRFAGKPVGAVNGNGYLCFRLNVEGYRWELRNHVVIFCLYYGYYPTKTVDHKDTNKLNNHPLNLRESTDAGNAQNRGAGKNNTHGHKNLEPLSSGNWRVRITHNGTVYRSSAMPLEKALEHRDIKLKEFHGEYANNGE
ncbi:hypothetical protein misterkot_77 [Salmonella phage misterkot]|uniref:HNH nuclease domain-containing protein n=2 Tax=Epseptimavirus TaxID=2732017 RepID=A0A6G8RGJ0_9CAUD|nr:hypothetical protein HWD24_gp080 [Salmonella phage rokbiter]QIN99857.1 hypothetical protein misterkot_77 [Salmonella phage misterkot]QIO00512.1 hypothetical protein rokbiter_80 [Salmonella phage rokbiter]